jgi:RHS repeat-associated protein
VRNSHVIGWMMAAVLGAVSIARAEVDQSGAFNYEVPITLPKAVGKAQPEIALSYDSHSGNGLVGVGWQLTGFPAITRVNFGAGINYNAGDTYAGPFGRLMKVDATNHVWHTAEQQTWGKYVAYRCDGSTWTGAEGDGGPCEWRMSKPDGALLIFGGTEDSRIQAVGRGGAIREWALSKYTDSAGNFYTVNYFEDTVGGDYRPTSVRYNQGHGRTTAYTVDFSYEARPDHSMQYAQSAAVDEDRRLQWISVASGGQLIRKYRLDYEQGATTRASRLIAVQEYGRDGTSTLPAQRFAWQEGSRGWAAVASRPGWGPDNGFTDANKYPLFMGDWNGDGRTDIGRVHNAGTGFHISTATGWQHYADDWDGGPNRGFTDAHKYPVLTGDWNGDGKTDFGRVNNAGIYFRVSSGSGWLGYPDGPSWGPNSGYTDGDKYPFLIGDWNGDGKTDIGRVHNTGTTFYVSTGAGWQHYADDWDGGPNRGFTDVNKYPVLIGDWNGDGKTDFGRVNNAGIYFRISTGSGWQGYPDRLTWGPDNGFVDGNVYPVLIGDWNGDGKTDIGRVHNHGIHFNVSTGAGWAEHAAGPNWSPGTGFVNASRYPIFTGDWDGDGKTDIGRVWNEGVGFETSTGQGWQAYAYSSHWGQNEGYVDSNRYPTLEGDWTGEGKSGLGRVDNTGITFITRTGAEPDLMTGITNQLGGTTTVTYRQATLVPNAVRPDVTTCGGPAGSTSEAGCGIANPTSAPLVIRIAVSDGRGNKYENSYHYYNGRYLPGRPGEAASLGFERTAVLNEQTNEEVMTRYQQLRPFHGVVAESARFVGSPGQTRALQARDLYEYTFVLRTSGPAAGTRSVLRSKAERKAYEFGVLKYQTRTLYSYDAFDNLTFESQLNDVATPADDVYHATSFINDASQWRIRLPYTSLTCADQGCSNVLTHKSLYYDGLASGQVGARAELTHVWQLRSDTNTWPGTITTYDAAGNVLTIKNAAGTITQRNEYDAASGLLIRVTDALGHSVSNTYDPATGELTAVTDPNGNTSTFFYDVFGRKRRSETPHDGSIRSVVEESWSFSPNLHVQTTHTDRGPLVVTKHLDGMGRVFKTQRTWDRGALIESEVHLDSAGREYRICPPHISAVRSPLSSCTTRHFDVAGRVVRSDAPRSGGGIATTLTEYDGYRTTVTDPLGNVTITDYDPATRTSTLTQPGGLVTATQKDLLGRVVRVTDPAGNVATYRYNSLGWKLAETDPVSGPTTFEFDVLGRVTSQTDAAGETIRMYYDAADRLVRNDFRPLSDTVGEEDTVRKYDYRTAAGDVPNGRGRLVRVQDRAGSALLAYDEAGRVRTVTKTVDGVQYLSVITYDRTGKRTSATYPDGSVVSYRYETEAGHLSAITLDGVDVMRYADYNERGAPTSITYGNALNAVSLTFEEATGKLLQTQDSRGFINTYYEYDERGMLIGELDQRSGKPNGDTSKAFAYDPLGQLAAAAMGADAACNSAGCWGSAWSKRYVYDNVGRVLEKDGRAFTYDAGKRFQLARVAGESADRTYDAVGRLLSKSGASGTDTYVNGADGFLHEHRRNGTLVHRMTYDREGNRIKKEYLGANAQTTWDLGNYKIVHDRASGKYFHTLYVVGMHGSRIAHRTVEKPGMAAAAGLGGYQDRAQATLYEPTSVAGFLPWLQHRSAVAARALITDIDGARGIGAAVTALAVFLCIAFLLSICARQLMSARRRAGWLAPVALCAMTAACVDNYNAPPASAPKSAESISKDGSYRISQALTPGGSNRPVPGTFYYLNSPLGSTSVMFDAQGAALLRLEYFPDGTVNQAASLGDYVATHTFGQKEFDKELDAYYNAFRYYDADTMRFTTPDAIKDSSDFLVHNIYAYTRNNPINYTDPTGYRWMQIDGPAGGVAAPRVKTPPKPKPQVYVPSSRPKDRTLTGRYNRGPDGGRFVGVHVETHIPGRDYMPADGVRGYAGISDKYEEELRVDRVYHHIDWDGPFDDSPSYEETQAGLAAASLAMDGSIVFAPFSWVPNVFGAALAIEQGEWGDAGLSLAASAPIVGVGADGLKIARAAKGAKGAPPLPNLDRTGKVHGALPRAQDLGRYSPDELRVLQDQLRQSVQQRIRKNIELGSDKAHGQRQAAEQQLIFQIDKHLSGS